MKWIRLILLLQFSLFLQMALPAKFCGIPVCVEFLFILVLLFSVSHGVFAGILAGFLLGGIQDILSLTPFGLNLITFTCFGLLGGLLRQILYFYTKISQWGWVIVGTISLFLVRYLIFDLSGYEVAFLNAFTTILIPSLIWNGIFGAFILYLFSWCDLAQSDTNRPTAFTTSIYQQHRKRMRKEYL